MLPVDTKIPREPLPFWVLHRLGQDPLLMSYLSDEDWRLASTGWPTEALELAAHPNTPPPHTSLPFPNLKSSARAYGRVCTSTALTAIFGALTLIRISFLVFFPTPASMVLPARHPRRASRQNRGKSWSSLAWSLSSGTPPPGPLVPQSDPSSRSVAVHPPGLPRVPHPGTLIPGPPDPSISFRRPADVWVPRASAAARKPGTSPSPVPSGSGPLRLIPRASLVSSPRSNPARTRSSIRPPSAPKQASLFARSYWGL